MICKPGFSVAARMIVSADPYLKYTWHFAGTQSAPLTPPPPPKKNKTKQNKTKKKTTTKKQQPQNKTKQKDNQKKNPNTDKIT